MLGGRRMDGWKRWDRRLPIPAAVFVPDNASGDRAEVKSVKIATVWAVTV